MADWATISSLATGGGTLVLAIATFSSVRSANRSARVAELSLLAGMRPLLVPSKEEDPPEHIRFGDDVWVTVPGHGAAAKIEEGRIYLAIGLRNGGSGLAVIHGWHVETLEPDSGPLPEQFQPELDQFRRQMRDLYIPAGDTGFWQGALRDTSDPDHGHVREAVGSGSRVIVDLLYGDHEGGQREIARFSIAPDPAQDGERAEVVRYWNIDRAAPRS
jgi:hypothetical protein